MKVYQGHSASPGLVLGQVSRVERRTESFRPGPFSPEREQRLLDNAVKTAQTELDSMAERSGPTEQAIFLFQSMMLEDEGFMNEPTSWPTWRTTPICSCAAWISSTRPAGW